MRWLEGSHRDAIRRLRGLRPFVRQAERAAERGNLAAISQLGELRRRKKLAEIDAGLAEGRLSEGASRE